MGRRWDTDERGRGIASADALLTDAERLVRAMGEPEWVAEDPEHHVLPHVRRACDDERSLVDLAGAAVDGAGVLVVDLRWRGSEPSRAELRAEVFRVLGSFAEASTFVAERGRERAFDVVTGMLEHQTEFAPHGHTVRFRVHA